jgi:hypothetical protein
MEKSNLSFLSLILLGIIAIIIISSLNLKYSSLEKSNEKNNNLADYDKIKNDLFNGKKLRFVFYYEKMSLYINGTLEPKSPNAVGGFDIDVFEYFGENVANNPVPYIAASSTVLIIHSRYGIINNYGKLRIFENNKIEVGVVYIDVKSTSIVFEEKFNTTLPNDAVRVFTN